MPFRQSVASLGVWGGGEQASAPTPLLRTYRCQNTPPSPRRDGWGRGSGALGEKGQPPCIYYRVGLALQYKPVSQPRVLHSTPSKTGTGCIAGSWGRAQCTAGKHAVRYQVYSHLKIATRSWMQVAARGASYLSESAREREGGREGWNWLADRPADQTDQTNWLLDEARAGGGWPTNNYLVR